MSKLQKEQQSILINGVLVIDVDEKSEAFKSGIRKNDVIVQIENSEISTLEDFKRATESKEKKRIFIYRKGAIFAVAL